MNTQYNQLLLSPFLPQTTALVQSTLPTLSPFQDGEKFLLHSPAVGQMAGVTVPWFDLSHARLEFYTTGGSAWSPNFHDH